LPKLTKKLKLSHRNLLVIDEGIEEGKQNIYL
jgi:hypothetical protein